MDTTYWGRNFGVMVFRDVATGRIVWKHYVRQETNALYVQGIDTIVAMGYKVRAVVCDGRRGLIEALNAQAIVVQMCQFHQLAIIRRYLGKHPLSEAARSLIALAKTMTRCTKAAFEAGLASWYQQYEAVVNLRQHDHAHRLRYVHRRLRSAYRSLLRNLSWLFSFEQPGLRIKSGHGRYGLPNTTNALDGLFADLKNKLRCHNGLSLRRKQRFIDEFFAGIGQDGQ